ncbi:MAG: ribosome maturation factor RimP [Bacilli bacterium]|nr:ribosome maturation factor RimP [Bacilli bacterium]
MDINYLKPLLEKKVNELGFELYSLTSKKENKNLFLYVVIDRVEPIDLNCISKVSETLSSYLDEIDQGNEQYTLDVSSLGAEKPLRVDQLSNYVSSFVNVRLINPVDGENILEGTIEEVNKDSMVLSYRIKTRVKKVNILLCNISKIRLAIKF